jgi:hypothetical protein
MTRTVDGSIAVSERFETRHWSVRPAACQIAVASLSVPVTISLEMPGAATITRANDEGAFTGDGADGGRFAPLAVSAVVGPLDPQASTEINASQTMDW